MERTWAEISLDNLEYNFKNIREKTAKNAKIMAIVKADAYGHGAVQVAKCLKNAGADCFGVALCDEGVYLRNNGIEDDVKAHDGHQSGGQSQVCTGIADGLFCNL